MGELLSYSLMSGILMLAMYLAYRLFLARDNQHAFNRGVLLVIYFVSFLTVPAISLYEKLTSTPDAAILFLGNIEGIAEAGRTNSEPQWAALLIWLYISGMVTVTIRTFCTWIKLMSVIRSGKRIKKDGYTLVLTDNERFAPFSWIRYVVISGKDFENNRSTIETHELKHVASNHWIDLLISQMVCIINWFNPVAWLMRDELILVHEYQADMAVLESGNNAQDYQMLLIKKAVGARFPSLANSLNHSKLKKRITMMYKEKSSAGRRLKALALLPMFALAFGVFSVPAVRGAVSAIRSSDLTANKVTEIPSNGKAKVRIFKVTNINSNGNETTVVINGKNLGNNLTVSGGEFKTGGKTYHAKSLQCDMTDGNATITAIFPFSEELRKPSMNLTVDGEKVPFNLEEFNDSPSLTLAGQEKKGGTDSNTKKEGADSPLRYYLDGKEITGEELKDISPENITSISIDKQNNITMISTK